VFTAAKCTVRPSVDAPATALELPASVSIQAIEPPGVTPGALKAAVNPFGKPEATLMLAPPVPVVPEPDAATIPSNVPRPPVCPAYSLKVPLAVAARPPTGVAVTVSVAVESDCT
jgi:hypothetical protein